MSRLTGTDAKNLREAYAAVYAPQITEEQVWEEVEEWVNSLVEEGYDLSEYSWEEMYEAYVEENTGQRIGAGIRDVIGSNWRGLTGRQTSSTNPASRATNALGRAVSAPVRAGINYTGAVMQGYAGQKTTSKNPISQAANAVTRNVSGVVRGLATGDPGNLKPPPKKEEPKKEEPKKEEPRREPSRDAETRTPAPPARPPGAASPSPKPAPAAAPAGQTGDKAKDMDTWAKANPKLAAAAAERQRIRGTQQTDNPLMKDFRSRLPMNSPSVQSPDVAKLGAGNQSLSQNPNALKAATPAATPKPTPAATTSTSAEPKSTPRVVQTSTPASVANPFKSPGSLSAATSAVKSATSAKPPEKRQTQLFHTDLYDLVKGHLLDEGYADSEESALAIMANMSEEWRESIVEAEVLAQKGGVPGTVQVQKKKEGGFLGFGGQTVSKPVPGTFKAKETSSQEAARYNVGVDRKFGGAAPGKEPTKSALSTQKTAQRSGHSGYMQVRDPGSLPNTGLPGKASPGRASDQNFAIGKPRNY